MKRIKNKERGPSAVAPGVRRPIDVAEAEEQLRKEIRRQHPEWVQADGECPMCINYELQLAEPFVC